MFDQLVKSVGFVTDAAHPFLSPDDLPVAAALKDLGVACRPVVWTEPHRGQAPMVLRSCWDYHLSPTAFAAWVADIDERGISLWNSPQIVAWNASKTYLADLEARGIRIVPTTWVKSMKDLAEVSGDVVVIKPEQSASAFGTISAHLPLSPKALAHVEMLLKRGAVMVQPFLKQIQSEGDYSLIFFEGKYSHSVIKRPRKGDFRVQDEFGGRAAQVVPDDSLCGWAGEVIGGMNDLLYARVDAVMTDDGPVLMELELIEPSLFLLDNGPAAAKFARCIADRL